MNILRIAESFRIEGRPISAVPVSSGHINDTCFVTTTESRYILQRMNRRVLPNPPLVMENIAAVTSHLRAKGLEAMTIIPTLDGGLCMERGGEFYRMYLFIENAESRLAPLSAEDFKSAGEAFGGFIAALGDMPISSVNTMPWASHDTLFHLNQLKKAISEDIAGRAGGVRAEIELAMAKSGYADVIRSRLISGELPLRVVHNDTKYSNIMIDTETHKARCILDLDNVMPGSLLYDYGDSIRSGCDRDGVFVPELMDAYREGFVGAVPDITELELELLPMAPAVITYENAIRYLTDYLNGDVYFKTSHELHNLELFRRRMELLKSMEDFGLGGL